MQPRSVFIYFVQNISEASIYIAAVFAAGQWKILEPVMKVEVTAPSEFQGTVLAGLNKRHALMIGQDATENYFSVICEVRLAQ